MSTVIQLRQFPRTISGLVRHGPSTDGMTWTDGRDRTVRLLVTRNIRQF